MLSLLSWLVPVDIIGVVGRCAGIFVAFALGSHLLWRDVYWNVASKSGSVAVIWTIYLLAMRPLIFPTPTYVYLLPSRGLAENSATAPREMIPRRAFVVHHEGPNVITHPMITLHDNKAVDQLHNDHVEQYEEIDPGELPTGTEPLHFWITPATPWDEDYTISITSYEKQFTERVRVECTDQNIFIGMQVNSFPDGKLIFGCEDKGFRDFPDWKANDQPCSSLVGYDQEANLSPRPFALCKTPKRLET